MLPELTIKGKWAEISTDEVSTCLRAGGEKELMYYGRKTGQNCH